MEVIKKTMTAIVVMLKKNTSEKKQQMLVEHKIFRIHS